MEVVPPLFLISAFPLWLALYNLILIRRISIFNDRIEATTALGSFRIPWKAVRSLKFAVLSGLPTSLLIRAAGICYIRVPWLPKHPNSTRSMLAIIRRLRQEERFKLLPFPAFLLIAAYGGDLDDN